MIEKFGKPEKKEEENFETILEVKVMRHGPKASAEGEKNDLAANFHDSVVSGWQEMDISSDKEGLAHIKASDIQRAQDTARDIQEKLLDTKHRKQKSSIIEKRLNSVFSDKDAETLLKLQSALKEKYSAQLAEEDLDPEDREIELRNRIDTEVLTRWLKDDSLFDISTDDLADRLAIRYAGFAKHLEGLREDKHKGAQPEDEPYLQIDISHSYPTMLFLKKYLVFDDGQKAEPMNPEDFFARTDGIIPESGMFEMFYGINNEGKVNISVKGKFKDKEFSGTLNTNTFAELYNQGKKHIHAKGQ